MKYRVASKEYIDNLKPGDKVYIHVDYAATYFKKNHTAILEGTFIRKTPKERLSIQYKTSKNWLDGRGKREIAPDGYHYDRYTLIEVVEI